MDIIIKYILRKTDQIKTLFWCVVSGLKFNPSWSVHGKIHIVRHRLIDLYKHRKGGQLIIGDGFSCNNKFESNSIGLIQPCLFNVDKSGSCLKIGNNVGISGTTINCTTSITIGDDVLIGSGCLITDTDSHQLSKDMRDSNSPIAKAPIVIEQGAFIGARSIILKGVTIGRGSVIGAGSVVTKSIPGGVIAAGNPATVIRQIETVL